MKTKTLLVSTILALAAAAGCRDRDNNAPSDEPVGKSIDQPPAADPPGPPVDTEPVAPQLTEDQHRWLTTKREVLDRIDATADKIRQQMNQAGDRVSDETRDALAALETKRRQMADELAKASERSADQWDTFKRDVDSVGEELEKDYNNLLDRMKTDDD